MITKRVVTYLHNRYAYNDDYYHNQSSNSLHIIIFFQLKFRLCVTLGNFGLLKFFFIFIFIEHSIIINNYLICLFPSWY